MRRINYLVSWSERRFGIALPPAVAPALRAPVAVFACSLALVLVLWSVQYVRLRSAERDGADYIGFGPLFPTGTKPTAKAIGLAEIRTLHEQVKLPIFCIGGVKLENLQEIVRAGASRVCIVSDLLLATDMVKRTAKIKSAIAFARGDR